MNIELPKIEYFLTNKLDKISMEQKLWYKLLQLRQSIVNTAIKDFVGLNKDNCADIELSDFLDKLYLSIREHLDKEVNQFLFDDFIFIAESSAKHIRNIVNQPSSKLIKVQEMVDYNKLKNTGIKTMTWLARQPGRTIKEKISPRNKVLTEVTKFSLDTKENETAMYLYKILYDIISARVQEFNQNKSEDKKTNKSILNDMQKLLSLNIKIKQSELNTIPKVLSNIKNNKLMCDSNYKIIWDSVSKIRNIKDELKFEWDNLIKILVKDFYYYLIAYFYKLDGIKIIDQIGKIKFINSELVFNEDNPIKFVNIQDNIINEYEFEYNEGQIVVYKNVYQEKDSQYTSPDSYQILIDINNYYECINDLILEKQEKLEKYNYLLNELENKEENIKLVDEKQTLVDINKYEINDGKADNEDRIKNNNTNFLESLNNHETIDNEFQNFQNDIANNKENDQLDELETNYESSSDDFIEETLDVYDVNLLDDFIEETLDVYDVNLLDDLIEDKELKI